MVLIMYLRNGGRAFAAVLLLIQSPSTLAAPIDAILRKTTDCLIINYLDRVAPCFPVSLISFIDRRSYWIQHIEDECFAKAAQGYMSDQQTVVKSIASNSKIMPRLLTGTSGNFTFWVHKESLAKGHQDGELADEGTSEAGNVKEEAFEWIEIISRTILDFKFHRPAYNDTKSQTPRPKMLKNGIHKRGEPHQSPEATGTPDQKHAAGKPIDGFHLTSKILEESKKKNAHVKGTAKEKSCARPLLEGRDRVRDPGIATHPTIQASTIEENTAMLHQYAKARIQWRLDHPGGKPTADEMEIFGGLPPDSELTVSLAPPYRTLNATEWKARPDVFAAANEQSWRIWCWEGVVLPMERYRNESGPSIVRSTVDEVPWVKRDGRDVTC
jgi:hypothetical protein